MMDDGFVGLIFSVFNSDPASGAHKVQATAFQSLPASSQLSRCVWGGGLRRKGGGEEELWVGR